MWTLHVEDFGKIESADITVSPLTLFVGDNNSGKSYLLSLLYGLMCADDVFANLCEDSTEYKECAAWAEAAISHEVEEEPFDDTAYAIFERLFNRILQDNQQAILQSIFHENVSAGKISVTFQREKNQVVSLNYRREDDLYTCIFPFKWFGVVVSPRGQGAMQVIIRYILDSMVLGRFANFRVSFLPTARTGFLLTYPALAQDAFSRAYAQRATNQSAQRRNANLSLTRPCTDFLSRLAAVNGKKISGIAGKYQSVIRFMESNLISGKILVSNETPLPEFAYRADNMEASLPMFLTSDVVKEIAPLILTLQYLDTDVLFIEEPEMSLHPKLQQAMARTLIKIANVGTPVLAATHSDTILQHVNNMIKLNNLPEARRAKFIERYKFDHDDPIPAEKVAMYQFDVQDSGRTTVTRLSRGEYGFEVPTFYDPLETLLEQTRETEPDAPDDEE